MKSDVNINNLMISVIIPLYNHERYIDAALDSVLDQALLPLEVIIIDDGSRDNSLRKAEARAARDSRILVHSQYPNQGAHYTMNVAIRQAKGEYISILNSDDLYAPERLSACLRILKQDQTADAVCSSIAFIDCNGRSCRNTWYDEARSFYKKCGDLALALINGNFLMTTSNLFIRRKVFDALGGFANLRYAHDLDFFLRLISHGRKIVLLDQPLMQYRMHDKNTIGEGVLKVKIEWAAVVAFFLWRMDGELGWDFLARLTEITDRHRLTRPVLFFFKYFQRVSPDSLVVETYLENPEFLQFLDRAIE